MGSLMWLHLADRLILDSLAEVWIISRVPVTTSFRLGFFTWWLQDSIKARVETKVTMVVLLESHMSLFTISYLSEQVIKPAQIQETRK